MSNFQSKNKQSRVPYEVRTPRFSNFPTLEPFHRDAYRSMAAYNAMLKTKKEQPEVPLQPRTPKESNFPTLEPFYCNAYRSMDSYNAMLKTKKERSCPCAWQGENHIDKSSMVSTTK